MFIAASSHCFADIGFDDACRHINDLEYDKVEIWLDESSNHLKPSEVAADPEGFQIRMRQVSRLTPVAFTFAHDISGDVLRGVCKAAKLLRVTQVSVPAAELGTPFNSEIDRLKSFIGIANETAARLSIITKTGHLTEDPHTAVELCQAVRGLGIALDPSYYMCGPHRNKQYEQVFPYVTHVLLRDTTPESLQVQVGLGEIDYAKIIASLKRENYPRALSVDFFPERMGDVARPLEMRKLRLLLETLL